MKSRGFNQIIKKDENEAKQNKRVQGPGRVTMR